MPIVLLNIDGLQPAYLGPYGCEWFDTPTFDRWAAAGVVYDRHFADVPRADGALSCHHAAAKPLAPPPTEHGVSVSTTNLRGATAALKKAAKLERSLVRIDVGSLRPPWKLGADDLAPFFDDSEELEPWLEPLPEAIEPDDDATFPRLQATYAAAIARLDSDLARIDFEGCTIIATSGRGLPLGEHGAAGFSSPLYEELVHLPLLIVRADGRHAGHRVSTLTQPMDVAATIAGLLGHEVPEGDALTCGRHLLEGTQVIRNHAVTIDGDRAGIRTPEWHWLAESRDEPEQLFVKPEDRWDMNDVAQHHPDQCDEFRVFLERFATAFMGER